MPGGGISVLWLALAFIVMLYLLVRWIISADDPMRYETAIVSAYALYFSFPAALGVLIGSIVPKTGMASYKRVFGIALLLLCIGVFMLHNYLQVKYR